MAANRFATLIHRKTNRMTLILIYAFLEWSLIFFLLLNSLFSYFILRFADYFGLKRPCLFCSRLDRFFDSSGKSPSHRDLLCDDHAFEIYTVFSKPLESKDLIDVSVEKKTDSSCFALIEPDLGDIGYSFTTNLIGDDDDIQIHNGKLFTQLSRSIFVLEDENIGSLHLNDSQERSYTKEEETENKLPSENDFKDEEKEVNSDSTEEDDDDEEEEFSCYLSSFDCNKQVKTEKEEENKMDLAPTENETAKATDNNPVESASPPPKSLEFYIDDNDCHLIPVESYKPNEEVREISDLNGDFILDFGNEPVFTAEIVTEEISAVALPRDAGTNLDSSADDDLQRIQNEEEEVSIGTEIPDHEQIGDIPSHKLVPNGDDKAEEEDTLVEFRTVTIEIKKPDLNVRLQETSESLHNLHDAMCQLDKRESEDESIGGVLTVDKLKLELEEERKALYALYAELEEERSASAVAASETMAMINRLHEEKAAMQMEALQYQRMMEEQSEFDQEALQLMNELVVKREKDNAELEKELEMCRKRLEEYDAKEKAGMILRRRMRDSSVDSCRNNCDSDENKSVERVSDSKYGESEMENTPVNVVLRLDECLDDYEEERLSILGRLKFLEEKISALDDEEEVEVKTFENNGNGHYHGKQHRGLKSKRLLPLFDAVDGEMENGNHNNGNGIDESEKGEIVTVEEEVDELYERLEALEADREFLRHCVGSLRKGDKGVHLLNEILQHLRDLKNIDLIRVRENEDMTF